MTSVYFVLQHRDVMAAYRPPAGAGAGGGGGGSGSGGGAPMPTMPPLHHPQHHPHQQQHLPQQLGMGPAAQRGHAASQLPHAAYTVATASQAAWTAAVPGVGAAAAPAPPPANMYRPGSAASATGSGLSSPNGNSRC